MKAHAELIQTLDQLVTVYRHLLDMVRKENEVLIAAEMKEVPAITEAKEKLIHKVRELDNKWQLAATELAEQLGFDNQQPTLLELSTHFSGDDKVKMEQLHSVLNMLVQRIMDLNKKNEILVRSALAHVTGAMDSITNTLNENPTYKKSGGMEAENKDAQGRLVSREA
jgi:flagellar biosynthesis/type III secretory pathway chaperone